MSPSGRDVFQPKLGLTLPLCGLNFIFFLLRESDRLRADSIFAFRPESALSQPWTFLTWQFLHTGGLSLFFGTMMLYILGMALETEWGTGEFTVFWLVATLGASGAAWILGQPLMSAGLVTGVSMLFAYAFLFPDTQFYIYFILPVKVKWLAWFGAAMLVYKFVTSIPMRGIGGASIELIGAMAGFLFFWARHRGRFKIRKAGKNVVEAVKTAGAVREDAALEKRNRELFPRVEALRAATRANAPTAETNAFAGELALLVKPGVNVCKPVDFKGDKDGICVKCEGFAECSLRYVAGQPDEIFLRERA
ncbi:MAG: rhomboid family intramembrane serine protease [Thermoanaerobaculia bacterium]